MIFEISNIIENQELKIKLLTYEEYPSEALDLSIFTSADRKKFNNFGSNKRKLEFFFTRLLWKNFSEYEPIEYTENGKPHITNGHISISHSNNTIAIAYSSTNSLGLDIEHFNPKISKIKDKFLSDTEQKMFDITDEKTITTLWSIKEAVYKLFSIHGMSFRDHIEILEIGELNEVLVKIEESNKRLTFSRLVFDKFILTYCTRDTLVH